MILSEISIRRPVICTVVSILLVLVGFLSFQRLPVREYPDTDVPVVSVTTTYPGASAEVIESRVTEPLEELLSTINGIRSLKSVSREQASQITIEFDLSRDVDQAANDVRDRVGRARARLPQEVDDPSVSKTEADSSPFIWISLYSDRYSRMELTEFADRYGKRLLQTLPGVGNIIIGGERRWAMRVWLSPLDMAAYELTALDVERALREQNVEIPGGRIESTDREFSIRVQGDLGAVTEFENVVLANREGYQVLLSDVARVELGAEDYRTQTFFNGIPTVGLGVVRQSQSNLLEVANLVKATVPEIQASVPEGVEVLVAYDSSLFVERSVNEVFKTLFFAFALVIGVVFFFLRDIRATIIPLVAVPVSIIGAFSLMQLFGFSINILTLLALVLSVGLVIDDAIVMLENIYRRIEGGEKPIRAAFLGSRQVAFAIIATTLTLIAVFLPVAFQSGSTGRLFFEFGLTLALAVSVSSFVALTLTPMLCSRFLKERRGESSRAHSGFYRVTEPGFVWFNRKYATLLRYSLRKWPVVIVFALGFSAIGPLLYQSLQREMVPLEDRGIFISFFSAPLGSTPEYTRSYIEDMEQIVRNIPEVDRNFSITAVGFGVPGVGNEGLMFTGLSLWEDRERTTQEVIGQLSGEYSQITGGMAFPIPIRPLAGGGGFGQDIQFVLRGQDFDHLQRYAGEIVGAMNGSGLFQQSRVEPSPNKPQLDVRIDRRLAADLNVPVASIATSLETLLGGRRVTQFKRGNEQYQVMVQIEESERVSPSDLGRIYVRSTEGALVQLSSLVSYEETVIPENYPHFNRFRSVNIVAQMASAHSIGEGVDFLSAAAAEILPPDLNYAWDGETREFLDSAGATLFLFSLAIVFTFLVLAAQFESFVHPITIFSGVVMAISGGLIVLYSTRFWGEPMTDNLFSRFGLIMLIGLVAKNGILIVEFANQLQVQGKNAFDAAYEAATLRFRPILMTAISTIFGVLPIALASGAGAETRNPLGIVVVGGLGIATVFSLFVVPVVYIVFDRMVVALTGRSSAHGLQRAKKIEGDMSREKGLLATGVQQESDV
ncbi:MAG: efflux RND transporter permease subunit [Opitutales bacterium]